MKWLLIGAAAGGVWYLHNKGKQRIERCCGAKVSGRYDQCKLEAGGNVIDVIRLGLEEVRGVPFQKTQVQPFRQWCEAGV